MGGKSSPAPAPAPPPDYMAQANAQMLLQRQQQEWQAQQDAQRAAQEAAIREEQRRTEQQAYERAQQAEAAKAQQAEAERQRQAAQRQAQFGAAYDAASTYDDQMMQGLGFEDTYGIADVYNQNLERWKGTTGANLDAYDGTGFDYQGQWQRAFDQVQNRERGNLQRNYTNITNPGWESGYIADTADDSILESILNDQYNAANSAFDTANKRGQITEGALASAMSSLGNKKLVANSNLQDLGMGVLGGYRGQLSDLGGQYADRVSSWNLGDTFNMDYIKSGFQGKTDSLLGRLEGDVRRAVGDTQLFDTSKLLAQAGVQGGVSNNPLQNAFANQNVAQNQDEENKRTTGTTGVF